MKGPLILNAVLMFCMACSGVPQAPTEMGLPAETSAAAPAKTTPQSSPWMGHDALWPLSTGQWVVKLKDPKTIEVFHSGESTKVITFDGTIGGGEINPNPAHPLMHLLTTKTPADPDFMPDHYVLLNLKTGEQITEEFAPCGKRADSPGFLMPTQVLWSTDGAHSAFCGGVVHSGPSGALMENLRARSGEKPSQAPTFKTMGPTHISDCAGGPMTSMHWASNTALRYTAGICGTRLTYDYDIESGKRSLVSVLDSQQKLTTCPCDPIFESRWNPAQKP